MSESEIRPFENASLEIPVRGFLHLPANPSGDGLILTHGAGANCQSALLITLASALSGIGIHVLRCDLPFRQLRPHGPPPRGSAERDQHGLRSAIRVMRLQVPGRIFLGGHSYGGRQASMLAASDPTLIDGLLLLSYPLHPPKHPEQMRTAHFPHLSSPALFVHGSRDGFGSIQEMTSALKLIPSTAELLQIAGAGHELLTTRNREELPKMVVDKFRNFLTGKNGKTG